MGVCSTMHAGMHISMLTSTLCIYVYDCIRIFICKYISVCENVSELVSVCVWMWASLCLCVCEPFGNGPVPTLVKRAIACRDRTICGSLFRHFRGKLSRSTDRNDPESVSMRFFWYVVCLHVLVCVYMCVCVCVCVCERDTDVALFCVSVRLSVSVCVSVEEWVPGCECVCGVCVCASNRKKRACAWV